MPDEDRREDAGDRTCVFELRGERCETGLVVDRRRAVRNSSTRAGEVDKAASNDLRASSAGNGAQTVDGGSPVRLPGYTGSRKASSRPMDAARRPFGWPVAIECVPAKRAWPATVSVIMRGRTHFAGRRLSNQPDKAHEQTHADRIPACRRSRLGPARPHQRLRVQLVEQRTERTLKIDGDERARPRGLGCDRRCDVSEASGLYGAREQAPMASGSSSSSHLICITEARIVSGRMPRWTAASASTSIACGCGVVGAGSGGDATDGAATLARCGKLTHMECQAARSARRRGQAA